MKINKSALKYFFLILDPRFCMPDYHYKSIIDIPIELLSEIGVESIILDIDQTITLPNSENINDIYVKKIIELMKHYKVCALSNHTLTLSKKESAKRSKTFNDKYHLKIISTKKTKPDPSCYKEAAKYLGSKPNKIVFIGDRITTDIIGSNLFGCFSILVNPINSSLDPLIIQIVRVIEKIIFKFYNLFSSKRQNNDIEKKH